MDTYRMSTPQWDSEFGADKRYLEISVIEDKKVSK